ncbi:MAG TPA: L-threonylcarbamoyladenylate synthase [Methanomassiliicoccales archaeon]|nr:L-threonylcarbamoyladenylate synthase [Methanomassiliicoccales archaeon]
MEIIKCAEGNCQKCDISEEMMEHIISELHSGRLIVYPTETLYGLGADPFDEAAVKRVFMAKKRPFDMPLSIAVSNMTMLNELAILDDRARKLADAFLPGPLTLLLQKKSIVPDIVTSASLEVGIRMPDHPLALRIIEEFGPIISTSANLHSHPNPYEVNLAVKDLGEAVSIYLDCGVTKYAKPSTIVQLVEGEVEVIRPGAIPIEKVEAVLHG